MCHQRILTLFQELWILISSLAWQHFPIIETNRLRFKVPLSKYGSLVAIGFQDGIKLLGLLRWAVKASCGNSSTLSPVIVTATVPSVSPAGIVTVPLVETNWCDTVRVSSMARNNCAEYWRGCAGSRADYWLRSCCQNTSAIAASLLICRASTNSRSESRFRNLIEAGFTVSVFDRLCRRRSARLQMARAR